MPQRAEKVKNCPGCRKRSCEGCAGLTKIHTDKTGAVLFPGGFLPEKGAGLGIAFDIGTTTLAAFLWDLAAGCLLGTKAETNPQRRYGADIISRLQAAENEEQRRELQHCLVREMDHMAQQLLGEVCTKAAGSASKREKNKNNDSDGFVEKATVVGNTAMCELFLGMRPKGLLAAPFCPDYREIRRVSGKELGFSCLAGTRITVLPPVGGYVGADALAVYACVDYEEKRRTVLALDIGTNGEILLRGKNGSFACSTAAGPALEGGAVEQGMRAVKGAIDKVLLTGRFPMQDILCRGIGEEKMLGICGSGLVDALALLLRTGVVDTAGYMRSAGEARTAGVPERLVRRIQGDGKERRFLLADEEKPVYLTAEDIRQLQLAVAAIRAGIRTLLSAADVQPEEIDKVYLAGAFGSYMDTENAVAVGLFPNMEREKLIQAGNLAGTGASMALLSERETQRMAEAAGRIRHVELADEKNFQELFLEYMEFRGK